MPSKYEKVIEYVDGPENGGQHRVYPNLPQRTMTLAEWDAASGPKEQALADGAYKEGRRERAPEPEQQPAAPPPEPEPAPAEGDK